MSVFSISFISSGLLSEVRTPCELSYVGSNNFVTFDAQWDTGANGTIISPNVVQTLGLKPQFFKNNITAGGTIRSAAYYVDIKLPNGELLQKRFVYECPMPDIDILIGMDIISLGDFAITHPNGDTLFSFQTPSTHAIDFTQP